MSQFCPHCGANLPPVNDAFCPECRNALDEYPADPLPPRSEDVRRSAKIFGIVGTEGLSLEELLAEIESGGRFVVYQYCVSVFFMTYLCSSKVHFVRSAGANLVKRLGYSILSLLVGWWGFPFGFIYTPMVVFKNLFGGKDVTEKTMTDLLWRMGRKERQARSRQRRGWS